MLTMRPLTSFLFIRSSCWRLTFSAPQAACFVRRSNLWVAQIGGKECSIQDWWVRHRTFSCECCRWASQRVYRPTARCTTWETSVPLRLQVETSACCLGAFYGESERQSCLPFPSVEAWHGYTPNSLLSKLALYFCRKSNSVMGKLGCISEIFCIFTSHFF